MMVELHPFDPEIASSSPDRGAFFNFSGSFFNESATVSRQWILYLGVFGDDALGYFRFCHIFCTSIFEPY